jgi:hypothetical protein
MARPQLSELLAPRGNQEDTIKVGEPPAVVEAPAPPAPAATDVAPAKDATVVPPEKSETSEAKPSAARPQASSASSKPAKASARSKNADLPPYLTFERKETRLRPDQVTSLNVKARELNKTKDPEADRITDNTLIRVAVDLILARADELHGGDETQLRKALGL